MLSPSIITELPWCPPEHLLPLCAQEAYSVFLDSGGDAQHERHRWSFLCPRPSGTLTIHGCSPSQYWTTLRQFYHEHTPNLALFPPTDIPFIGGIIGLASYEAGLACENVRSRHRSQIPSFIVLACRHIFAFDRLSQRLWWISPDGEPPPNVPQYTSAPLSEPLHFTPDHGALKWNEAICKLRHYIQQGDIFQANLTMRWHASRPASLNLYALYTRLRQHCPAPFGAWFHSPNVSLLSASVERFIHLSSNGKIETRPIKGTIGIDPDPTRNAALQKTLARDEKEHAENLMITDLMRHDIGRVCKLGSVHVPQLCAVERFAHVHHLVSSVCGTLKSSLDAIDLLAATLPPGSVTGAPKHRALEIIDELEISAREAYCGTLFRLGWNGDMDSSVIIRSVSATPHTLSLGAGGGITWPSDAAAEYREMCLKAAPLLNILHTS